MGAPRMVMRLVVCAALIAVVIGAPRVEDVVPETELSQAKARDVWGDVEHWFEDEYDWLADEASTVKPPTHGKCYDKLEFQVEEEIYNAIKAKAGGIDVPEAGYEAAKAVMASTIEKKLADAEAPLNMHCKDLTALCTEDPRVFAACKKTCSGGDCSEAPLPGPPASPHGEPMDNDFKKVPAGGVGKAQGSAAADPAVMSAANEKYQ